jgi:FixJ family two-component response regulator
MPELLVHVVDDDPGVRGAISRLLRSCDISVETYESSEDFLKRRPGQGPGCLILDLSMPDMDGLQLQEVLAQTSTRLAVVFVTGNAGIADSVRAMKAGAVDFLTKPFEDTQLLSAVEVAFQKSRKMHEEAEEIERCWRLYDSLTPRERQVCISVSRGLLNKQVGGELGIQEKTIKLHRSNVMRKLGVTSLADLVRLVESLRHAGRLDSFIEPAGLSAQSAGHS